MPIKLSRKLPKRLTLKQLKDMCCDASCGQVYWYPLGFKPQEGELYPRRIKICEYIPANINTLFNYVYEAGVKKAQRDIRDALGMTEHDENNVTLLKL